MLGYRFSHRRFSNLSNADTESIDHGITVAHAVALPQRVAACAHDPAGFASKSDELDHLLHSFAGQIYFLFMYINNNGAHMSS